MIPLWASLAILAAVLSACGNIVQKFVMKKDFKSYSYVMLIGIVNLIYTIVSFFFVKNFSVSMLHFSAALLSGIICGVASVLYIHSIKHEEVSRVVPIASVQILLTALFAATILKETFSPRIYIAIFMMFTGSFLLSFRFKAGHIKKIGILLPLLATLVLFSLGNVLIKFAFLQLDYYTYIFCAFFGYFMGTVPLWFSKKRIQHFIRNYSAFKNVKLVLFSEIFGITGSLLVVYAILLGPISLIASLNSLNIIFVFLFILVINKFNPKLIKEEFNGNIFWIKLIAIIFLLVGTFILVS